MRWCFKTSATPYADSILQQLVAGSQAYAPALWLYEVASVLAKGEKDNVISASDASDFIADLAALDITVDPESTDHVLTEVRRLAGTYGLTGYDAAYLELALGKNLPLATLDDKLIKACNAMNHPLV